MPGGQTRTRVGARRAAASPSSPSTPDGARPRPRGQMVKRSLSNGKKRSLSNGQMIPVKRSNGPPQPSASRSLSAPLADPPLRAAPRRRSCGPLQTAARSSGRFRPDGARGPRGSFRPQVPRYGPPRGAEPGPRRGPFDSDAPWPATRDPGFDRVFDQPYWFFLALDEGSGGGPHPRGPSARIAPPFPPPWRDQARSAAQRWTNPVSPRTTNG